MDEGYIDNLLRSHSGWNNLKLDLKGIEKIHLELKHQDPFTNYGYKDINGFLGVKMPENYNPETIDFLFIDDVEFDGDLSVFNKLQNLQMINISGVNIGRKISNIDSLLNHDKLKYLDMKDNQVDDISVLPRLKVLEELSLTGNPIENIDVLSDMSNLKWLSYTSLQDSQAARILIGNPLCHISYCDEEKFECYDAFLISDNPIKITSYQLDGRPYHIQECSYLSKSCNMDVMDLINDVRVKDLVPSKYSKDYFSFEDYGDRILIWYEFKNYNG